MPYAAKTACTKCGKAGCDCVRQARSSRRGTSCQRGYGYRWQRAREVFLQTNPLCIRCRVEGKVSAATVVDHVVPHRGDDTLFWDMTNWQPLCKRHHDQKTGSGR